MVVVIQSALLVGLVTFLAQTTKAAPLTSSPVGKSKPNNRNKYKINIELNHVTLEEELVIDTTRGTEMFLIPKHKLEVLKDFSKKLDVILDNKTNVCYVSRQQRIEERPVTLKSLMENKSIYKDNNLVLKDTTTWKVDAIFTQRFLLSKEMAEMCARSPIYWIQKVKGTGSDKQSRDEDVLEDSARSVCVSYLCWYTRRYTVARSAGRRKIVRINVKRCYRIKC